jgi:hypothetical protein
MQHTQESQPLFNTFMVGLSHRAIQLSVNVYAEDLLPTSRCFH